MPEHRDYVGPITNTHRWRHFEPRPDDIFICTPPKSGTTWTQAICAMLVFGRVDHGELPAHISPWVDAEFEPIEDYLRIVDGQRHRRFLKTHTPFDGIPYRPECTYRAVFRDPRDVYESGSDHRDNMTNVELAQTFPSGDGAFEGFLNDASADGEWDMWTLDTIVRMLKSYWSYRHLPNVHLFHYSDMRRDLRAVIASMAQALGYDYSPETIEAFAEAAGFEAMKRDAGRFAPQAGIGFWKSDDRFFVSGRHGEWQTRWTDDQRRAFEARIASMLDPDSARWLLGGAR
jgi:aryl sulfotransferase